MDNLIILDSERRYFPASSRLLKKVYESLEDKYLKCTYKFFILPKIRRCIRKGDCIIIAADKETELILSKKKIPFSRFNDYCRDKDFEEYEKKMLQFVRAAPKLVPELDLKYKDIPLWKFDETDMAEKFFPELILRIEVIDKIIAQENVSKIIVLNSSSRLGTLQKCFAGKVAVEDRTDPISKLRKNIFDKFMIMAVKTVGKDLFKKPDYMPKKANKVIFFDEERSFKKSAYFLEKIKNKVTVLHENYFGKGGGGFQFDSLEDYITPEAKRDIGLFRRDLKTKLRRLKNSSAFKNQWRYKDVSLFDPLKEMLEYLYVTGYVKSAYYIESINRFLEINQPKLIINRCEGLKRQKIVLHLSKKHGIKTLLLIHGTISERDRYDHLISDKIAVYGDYYKKILIKLKNDKKKITTTGNPEWDCIGGVKLNREEIGQRLNLPPKKIILFATTNIPIEVRDRNAFAVFRAMLNLPEYHLAIKLHPEEEPDFYQELSKKFNLDVTITGELLLLHPLIKYSELVIISESTVGVDAILIHKPLIDMNLLSAPYWNDYIKEKVALGIRKEEDLLPAMKSILKDETVRKKLEKNRKKYIYEHAYKQDGKASERVVKLINQMLKEAEKEKKQARLY